MGELDKDNVSDGNIAEHDTQAETDTMLVKDSSEKSSIRDDGNKLEEEIKFDSSQPSLGPDTRKQENLWVRLKNDKFQRIKYIMTIAYIISFLTLVRNLHIIRRITQLRNVIICLCKTL
jgi:hypothetical protein